MPPRIIVATLVALLVSTAHAEPPEQDWVRTETRADCSAYDPLRTPFFGETHVHTGFSGDAAFARVRTDPRDAFLFAQGDPIDLPPYDAMGVATRSAQLRRPLDFTAISDHAEFFGENRTCMTEGLPGYDHALCVELRNQLAGPINPVTVPIPAIFATFQLTLQGSNPTRLPLCGAGDVNCLAQAAVVWEETQDAAEEFYDRTAACTFTTFVGYEWTNNLGGFNLHRNIIFRNADVQPLPTSYYEEPLLEGLFTALEAECLAGPGQCDFVSIPHNSNASGGLMFEAANGDGSPLTGAAAARRAAHETLVEVYQHKGSSECSPQSSPNDELCGFELLKREQLFGGTGPLESPPPSNFARDALKQGLVQENLLGANPFQFGMIGSTDTHNATPGATNEADFPSTGHLGVRDFDAPSLLSRISPGGIVTNGGGLAVLWAEENSRDALFAAMRRREAYATSGTRPLVRFFGGRAPRDACDDPDFVAVGYGRGVPMGGEIGPVLGRRSPRFAVLAMKDPGGNGEPSTPLQRIQIVKGWVDDGGVAREKVFDVAGDRKSDAGVDGATCTPTGSGFDTLCTVWSDPSFRAHQRAFYYARVLENPVCRWHKRLCNDLGVDCSNFQSVPVAHRECCLGLVPPTIQERAVTSPIWYQPEGFGVKGNLKFRDGPGDDLLRLRLLIGAVPPELDVTTEDLVLTLEDDDQIFSVTLPAGSLVEKTPGRRFVYKDSAAPLGVKRVVLKINRRGTGKLIVYSGPVDLSSAELADHRIDTRLTVGAYDHTDSRTWELTRGQLRPER